MICVTEITLYMYNSIYFLSVDIFLFFLNLYSKNESITKCPNEQKTKNLITIGILTMEIKENATHCMIMSFT